jgi:hypothetical protein
MESASKNLDKVITRKHKNKFFYSFLENVKLAKMKPREVDLRKGLSDICYL